MKLLIDLTSLYDHLTGIERFADNLSLRLIRAHPEHSYTLLFKNEIHCDFRELSAQPNVECRVLSCGNRVLFSQLLMPLLLYRLKADLYFFPAFCAPWLFFSPKSVNTVHDLSDFECCEGKAPLKVLYSRLGIIHAKYCSRHIVTVSGFSRERIAKKLRVPEEKITVIGNGVSESFRRGEESRPSGRRVRREIAEKYHLPGKYILSVSTLEPRKNIRLLIRAFMRLREVFPDTDLVLCGRAGWNLKEVFGTDAKDGEAASLPDRIRVTGFVDDADLPLLYQGAEWFVFPSKYEGFGIPPLEAMGLGCPVLSSDAASLPEVLGDCAVYFRSGDEDSLVRQLENCLRMSRERRDELVRKGLKRADLFTWEASAEKLHGLLEQLL